MPGTQSSKTASILNSAILMQLDSVQVASAPTSTADWRHSSWNLLWKCSRQRLSRGRRQSCPHLHCCAGQMPEPWRRGYPHMLRQRLWRSFFKFSWLCRRQAPCVLAPPIFDVPLSPIFLHLFGQRPWVSSWTLVHGALECPWVLSRYSKPWRSEMLALTMAVLVQGESENFKEVAGWTMDACGHLLFLQAVSLRPGSTAWGEHEFAAVQQLTARSILWLSACVACGARLWNSKPRARLPCARRPNGLERVQPIMQLYTALKPCSQREVKAPMVLLAAHLLQPAAAQLLGVPLPGAPAPDEVSWHWHICAHSFSAAE